MLWTHRLDKYDNYHRNSQVIPPPNHHPSCAARRVQQIVPAATASLQSLVSAAAAAAAAPQSPIQQFISAPSAQESDTVLSANGHGFAQSIPAVPEPAAVVPTNDDGLGGDDDMDEESELSDEIWDENSLDGGFDDEDLGDGDYGDEDHDIMDVDFVKAENMDTGIYSLISS
jgi:hypothetical protein